MIQLPVGLFDSLLARQRAGIVEASVAAYGPAVWLGTSLDATFYFLGDGRVIITSSLDVETPLRIATEEEALQAIVAGSKTLVEAKLLDALPARPPAARDCSRCGGTRWWKMSGTWTPSAPLLVCPDCSGRGWAA